MLLDALRFNPDAAKDPGSPPVVTLYTLITDEVLRRDRLGGPAQPIPERLPLYTPELCDELEKWLPLVDANDVQYGHFPGWTCGQRLRRMIDDARAAHARTP